MTLRPDEPALVVRADRPTVVNHGITLMCSARGCRRHASWGLRWNNAKLHPPERRKTWLACDEHRDTLGSFLTVRGFLRETVPVGDLDGS